MAALISGTFTGTGTSATSAIEGAANLLITFHGTAIGEVVFERSFDGVNYYPLTTQMTGEQSIYTQEVNKVFNEPEAGVTYRLRCSRYVSGTITYRIGQ